MKKPMAILGVTLALSGLVQAAQESAGKILILQDEMPQMEVLAKRLRAEGYSVDLVSTKENLPPLEGCLAAVVFVHGNLPAPQAEAVIRYTRAGGRMIALHHTISSGKLKTPVWLEFLGVTLPQPQGKPQEGGYAWEHDADLRLVNLAPGHYITSHNIKYPNKIEYKRSDIDEPARQYDGLDFPASEVYINHQFTDTKDRTILFGFSCRHPKLGEKTWMQDRGGWLKKAEKGWAFYFMPGHTKQELENPIYQQIILNCLTWKP